MNFNRLLFQITRLGWPAALGAGLLLAALALDLQGNRALEDELTQRRAEAARRDLLPLPGARRPVLVIVPGARVEAVLPRLFTAAHHHGLVLGEGRYAESGKAGAPRRLQIDLPMSGSYPALRAFLAEVLESNPALVLENLDLTRPDIASTELEAHPRFSLTLEATP